MTIFGWDTTKIWNLRVQKKKKDITQRLKVVHSSVTSYDIAGEYFQALGNIIAPAAPMVRQQSSLIITPEREYSS